MADKETSVDKEFREVLARGLAETPPLSSRRTDKFILHTLNHDILGPICESALATLSQYGEEEITKFIRTGGYEVFSFPAIALPDEQGNIDRGRQYALSLFFTTYDPRLPKPEEAPPEFLESIVTSQAERILISQKLRGGAPLSPEKKDKLVRRMDTLESRIRGIGYILAHYEALGTAYAKFISQDPHERELFIKVVKTAFMAPEFGNYNLSDITNTFCLSPAQAIKRDPDFENHFISDTFPTANWCVDRTITKDLLTTANIMLEVLPGLKELSTSIAYANVDFVRSEVVHAKDAPFPYGLLMTYAEGIYTIVQVINLALGQQLHETNKTDANVLVHQILQSHIPQKMAKDMPSAIVGPTSINGRYIKALLLEGPEGILEINSDCKETSKEEKLSVREARSRTFGSSLESVEAYIGRDCSPGAPALSFHSGNVCPVSLPSGIDTQSHRPKPSYIDYLSGEFERIFTIVRQLRQKGIAID